MDKSKLGVVGAISSLVALPAMAQPAAARAEPPIAAAQSYAELLQPIPNAVERLQRANLEESQRPLLIRAQYGDQHHHHQANNHHHHHQNGGHHHHHRRSHIIRRVFGIGGGQHHHHNNHGHHHNNE